MHLVYIYNLATKIDIQLNQMTKHLIKRIEKS